MKKLINLALCLVMVFSVLTIPVAAYSTGDGPITVEDAIKEHEVIYNEKVETNRYYFLMPNGSNGFKNKTGENNYAIGDYVSTWYNDYADKANIYWKDTGIADAVYPGYIMMQGDCNDVYYADVPQVVTEIIFNNGVNYYSDTENKQYYARRSVGVACEYYDVGESDNYPDGTDSFDNMIYVINPNKTIWAEDATTSIVGLEVGEWYYYYGDGCFGVVKDGNCTDCIRDDHQHDVILGDVDYDCELSILDVTYIQRVLAQLDVFSAEQMIIADVNRDGETTIFDATAIQRKLAKFENYLVVADPDEV